MPLKDLLTFTTKFDKLASWYLINSLRQTSSLLDAYEFCESTIKRYEEQEVTTSTDPTDTLTTSSFLTLRTTLMQEMNEKLERSLAAAESSGDTSPEKARTILSSGTARREKYPWNTYEPDRFSPESLAELNVRMVAASEKALGKGNAKCEARVVSLPDLSGEGDGKLSLHLGIFATKDVFIGEVFFEEDITIAGAPYPGRRVLCDYCCARLPSSDDPTAQIFTCPKCPTPTTTTAAAAPPPPTSPAYCSQKCLTLALEAHHPTLCGKEDDIHWLYTDLLTSPNPVSIYSTLLIKFISTSLSRHLHPLDLPEVKYLYGAPIPLPNHPMTMRYDFTTTTLRPLHLLTQSLNLDPYHPSLLGWFDTWVISTLLMKIMGTCSGRFEGDVVPGNMLGELQGCEDRPDVVNVFPTWSLVNHDCGPNVGWRPDSGMGRFWGVDRERLGEAAGVLPEMVGGGLAVRCGEEVLSCYTDRRLGVRVRREWAREMLGGECRCGRCVREEAEEVERERMEAEEKGEREKKEADGK